MIHLSINPQYMQQVDTGVIELAFLTAKDQLGLENIDLSVVLESDPFVARLNNEYRGLDQPTDVLSFEMDHMDPETGSRYLGDIIISIDTAQRQAQQRNIPLMSEICLLFVHGLLHLNGYDHLEIEERDEMWKLQQKILTSIGLDPDQVNPGISER